MTLLTSCRNIINITYTARDIFNQENVDFYTVLLKLQILNTENKNLSKMLASDLFLKYS